MNHQFVRDGDAEVFHQTLAKNVLYLFTLRYSKNPVTITLKAKHLELNA
jgi:hypothetical protein